MNSFGYKIDEIVRFSNRLRPQKKLRFSKYKHASKLKEQLINDWCVQFWSKTVRFETPMCSHGELESVQKRAARFVTEIYNHCLKKTQLISPSNERMLPQVREFIIFLYGKI